MRKQICGIALVMILALLSVPAMAADTGSAAEAAAQAGYQDYSTFSRAYKKQFGHGPSADTKGKQQDLQITTQEF